METQMTDRQLDEGLARLQSLRDNLERIIYGKREAIDILIVSLLAGGSVLMEDVPGVGKTTLAKALSRSIDAKFSRIQFTPDLLPADILGSSVYNPVSGAFDFRHGPIFCNILLADEINRASPRTQSALLEAMNEGQATIESRRYPLPAPFMVLATQNPIDFHGTYPLPEAQLDRFLVLLDLGYPDEQAEIDILHTHVADHPLETLQTVTTRDEILSLQQASRNVRIDRSISQYIVDIARLTRQDPRFRLGVSPRGSMMLCRAAQATAITQGRNYVLPDDVKRLAPYVLPHRIILTSKSRYDGTTKRSAMTEIMARVKVPT